MPAVHIVDLPVPQMEGAVDIPPVREQVIVQHIPDAHVADRVSRVRVPQMVFPLVDVPKIDLQVEIQRTMSQYGDTDMEHVELYSQRATLLPWSDREWEAEERGDAKLLLHNSRFTVRFRQRQETKMEIVSDLIVGVDADTVYKLGVVGLRPGIIFEFLVFQFVFFS